MLLLPPILSVEAARGQAEGVVRMRDTFGYEVLPENPPGHVSWAICTSLDFYAQVADLADTGLLLDCAHLAIYQRLMGHEPLTGLDGLPLDRVVELHVAGSTPHEHEGFTIGKTITPQRFWQRRGRFSTGSPTGCRISKQWCLNVSATRCIRC